MADLFKDTPEAMINTQAIAEQCNLELRFDEKHIPRITVPQERPPTVIWRSWRRKGWRDGLHAIREKRISRNGAVRYRARLEEELKIIKSMGYPGYFLIVYDFIHYAKSRGIPVGPGRGSAAGSLVAYSLNITDLDPIEYDLIFERFLNPGRKSSMPDVDIDFCMEGRDDVIRYVSGEIRKRECCSDHHFRKDAGKGSHPGRRPCHGNPLCGSGPDCETHSETARYHPGSGLATGGEPQGGRSQRINGLHPCLRLPSRWRVWPGMPQPMLLES